MAKFIKIKGEVFKVAAEIDGAWHAGKVQAVLHLQRWSKAQGRWNKTAHVICVRPASPEWVEA